MNVLFLCHGNVNRSAAGHIIMEQKYPKYNVKSAGLKTTDGKITAKKMRDSLNERGYPNKGIRSSICTKDLMDWADVVFYMDNGNEKRLDEQFGLSDKCFRLSNFLPGVNKIPDPAFAKGTEMHHKVITMIEKALETWTEQNSSRGHI